MRREVEAIRAALAPVGMPVHWERVPEPPAYPYFLLWQSTGSPLGESDLSGADESVDAVLGLTSVGQTPEQAMVKADQAKAILSPAGRSLRLVVPGREALIRWSSFAMRAEDRDVSIPLVGYPQVYVNLYRLTSHPT